MDGRHNTIKGVGKDSAALISKPGGGKEKEKGGKMKRLKKDVGRLSTKKGEDNK